MQAGRYDIEVHQGTTLQLTLTWKDSAGAVVNLTGYTAKMQVREEPGDTILVSLTQASGLTLGGAAGTIAILVSAATTAAIPIGRYAYDILLTSGAGIVTALLEGAFTIKPTITV